MSLSPMCLLTIYVSILENYLSMYLIHDKTVLLFGCNFVFKSCVISFSLQTRTCFIST